MTGILKNSNLSYRLLVEKIDGRGNKTVIGDTGFVHVTPETKCFIQMILEMMERDKEFKDKINKIVNTWRL